MVLQESGRIAVAKAIMALPIYIALASGDPAQDSLSLEQITAGTPANANGVTGEFGRRLALATYVTPDPGGTIEVFDFASGINRTYATSPTPTAYLHLRATFDHAEGLGEVLREVGIFVGGSTNPALPPGQQWFEPGDIVSHGDCYMLRRIERFTLDGASKTTHETVLPI